jgi:glyoxylase-like metal-dependent hydrolase (beta-lactamase superfamily II)
VTGSFSDAALSSPQAPESAAADGVTAEGESWPSQLNYIDQAPPASGTAVTVASGVDWCRIPLPIDLNHINVWMLSTADGCVVVDTGMSCDPGRDEWFALADSFLADKPLRGVFVTHIHPDHFGLAAWLQEHHRVPVWMSRRTFEQAEQLLGGKYLADPNAAEVFFRANGVSEVTTLKPMFSVSRLAKLASGLPRVLDFIADGDVLPGLPQWRALETNGHAEGHLCVMNDAQHLLISGDQVLPTISSNISFSWRNRDADPLRSFLDSLQRLRQLPADTLVLPSHGVPFRGLRERIDDLLRHHRDQLQKVSTACRQPRSAADLLPLLFKRPLIGMHLFLALGEALAHLEYLVNAGGLERQTHADGVVRYSSRA